MAQLAVRRTYTGSAVQYYAESEALYNRYIEYFSASMRQKSFDKWGSQIHCIPFTDAGCELIVQNKIPCFLCKEIHFYIPTEVASTKDLIHGHAETLTRTAFHEPINFFPTQINRDEIGKMLVECGLQPICPAKYLFKKNFVAIKNLLYLF